MRFTRAIQAVINFSRRVLLQVAMPICCYMDLERMRHDDGESYTPIQWTTDHYVGIYLGPFCHSILRLESTDPIFMKVNTH